MIAPIRPPLVKPPRRSLRETPLQRARRAVAESLLSMPGRQTNPRLPSWFRRTVVSVVFTLALLGICYLLMGMKTG